MPYTIKPIDWLAGALAVLTFLLANKFGAGLMFLFGISIIGIPIALLIGLLPALTLWVVAFRLVRAVLPVANGAWKNALATVLATTIYLVPAYISNQQTAPALARIEAASASLRLPPGAMQSFSLVVPDTLDADELLTKQCPACWDGLVKGRITRLEVARLSAYAADPAGFEAIAFRFGPSDACPTLRTNAPRGSVIGGGIAPLQFYDFESLVYVRALAGNCFFRELGRHTPSDVLIVVPRLASYRAATVQGLQSQATFPGTRLYTSPITFVWHEGRPDAARATDTAFYAKILGPFVSFPYMEPSMGMGVPDGMRFGWACRERSGGIWDYTDLSMLVAALSGPTPQQGYAAWRNDQRRGISMSSRTYDYEDWRTDLRQASLALAARPAPPDARERTVVRTFIQLADRLGGKDRALAQLLRENPKFSNDAP